MKNNSATIALMAVLAIGSGLAGYSFAGNGESLSQQATSFAVKPAMSGYLTVEAFDEAGNLKAVRTSDNIITNQGENCALRMLFTSAASHASTGSTVCTGALTSPFTWIAVGTGLTQEDAAQLQLTTESTTLGLGRAPATTVTWTNSTGSGQDTDAEIQLAKTFSVSGGSATITEAGLFNSTLAVDTDAMFARKTFSGVTVNDGDSLTVTWTIKVGNTTTIN